MTLFKPITNRKGETYVVKVDYVDSHLFLQYSYFIKKGKGTAGYNTGKPYVARSVNQVINGKAKVSTGFLHLDILEQVEKKPSGFVADHIDRQTLNNCRNNLRWVSHSGNMLNRDIFLKGSNFITEIKKNGVSYYQVMIGKKYVCCPKDYAKAVQKRDEHLKTLGQRGLDALEEIYKNEIR